MPALSASILKSCLQSESLKLIVKRVGLSVIETKRALKEKEIAQSRIANYNRNSGKMNLIKNDIDEAIKNTNKYQDFVNVLVQKGYYIKKSNNTLSISTPYFNRNIRLARAFGEDYTLDNIKNRIYYKNYEYEANNNKIYKIKIYDGVKINYAKFQKVEVSREGKKSKKINLLK